MITIIHVIYTFIVGGVSEHETLGNVECYDPETNRWVVDVIPQMNYRRSGVGESGKGRRRREKEEGGYDPLRVGE